MTSKRKFYRTVIQVEVLSEEHFSFGNLADIHYAVKEDDCSGGLTTVIDNQGIDGPQAAKLLVNQGSDLAFFNLTEEGEDVEYDDDHEDLMMDLMRRLTPRKEESDDKDLE